MSDPLDTFIDALPKVELHLHLEGSVRPETLLALARRHRTTSLPTELDALREFYRFRDFPHFVEVYYAICDNLRTAEDFALVVRELGDTLAEQHVPYAEVTFTPFNHTRRGVPAEAVFAGVEQGRVEAEESSGTIIRWCTDVPGEFGADAGVETARMVLGAREAGRLDGAVSFGLGGPEVGVPRGQFAEAFAMARDAGLHSVPHAGETTGASTIREAVEQLGAERVGHGVRCLEDPDLVALLRERRIALEVCPTSNLRLSVVGSYAEHPLPRLLAEGLTVTLASDDPPMFGTTLRREYRIAVEEMGLVAEDLVTLARTGVEVAFLPDERKQPLLDAIAAVPLPGAPALTAGRAGADGALE
jgi:aminodeoxyfutalosine deaminase